MASDIKMLWDNDLMEADMSFSNDDLIREEGLETAVVMSLFTDRRANEDDIIDNSDDMRGWWGDQTSDIPNDRNGSRLWLLERAKVIPETLTLAKKYAEESLEWMIDDGVAVKVEVVPEVFGEKGNERLGLTVKIYKEFNNIEVFEFDNLWEAQYV